MSIASDFKSELSKIEGLAEEFIHPIATRVEAEVTKVKAEAEAEVAKVEAELTVIAAGVKAELATALATLKANLPAVTEQAAKAVEDAISAFLASHGL